MARGIKRAAAVVSAASKKAKERAASGKKAGQQKASAATSGFKKGAARLAQMVSDKGAKGKKRPRIQETTAAAAHVPGKKSAPTGQATAAPSGKKSKKNTPLPDDVIRQPNGKVVDLSGTSGDDGDKVRHLRKTPTDDLIILACKRRYPHLSEAEIREKNPDGESMYGDVEEQYEKKKSSQPTHQKIFWAKMDRKYCSPSDPLKVLKKDRDSDPYTQTMLDAIKATVGGSHPNFGPLERQIEQIDWEPHMRDAIGGCRVMLNQNYLGNDEHARVFEKMMEWILMKGLQEKYKTKLYCMKPSFDKYLHQKWESLKNTPKTQFSKFMSMFQHLLPLVASKEQYDPVFAALEAESSLIDQEENMNVLMAESDTLKAMLLKSCRKLLLDKVRRVIARERDALKAKTGTLTAQMFAEAKQSVYTEIGKFSNLDEVEGKRTVVFCYREKVMLRVLAHSIAEEIDLVFMMLAKSEAVEYGELEELIGEHGFLGEPDPAKKTQPGQPKRIDPFVIRKAIEMRSTANQRKKETEGIVNGTRMAQFVREIETCVLKTDSTMKGDLALFSDIQGETGAEMWRKKIASALSNSLLNQYYTINDSLSKLQDLKLEPLANFVHQDQTDELEIIIKALKCIQTGEAISVEKLQKNEYRMTLIPCLELYISRTENEDGSGTRLLGRDALKKSLEELVQKNANKERFTKTDLFPFTAFAYLCDKEMSKSLKTLNQVPLKRDGAAIAMENAKRIRYRLSDIFSSKQFRICPHILRVLCMVSAKPTYFLLPRNSFFLPRTLATLAAVL